MFAHRELGLGLKNEHRVWHKAQSRTCRPGNVREDRSKALKSCAALRSMQILQIHHKETWPESGFQLDFKERGAKKGSGRQCMGDEMERVVENFLYFSVTSGCKNLISHVLLCLPGASREKMTPAFTSKCYVMSRKLCHYSALIKTSRGDARAFDIGLSGFHSLLWWALGRLPAANCDWRKHQAAMA